MSKIMPWIDELPEAAKTDLPSVGVNSMEPAKRVKGQAMSNIIKFPRSEQAEPAPPVPGAAPPV